MSIWHTMEPHLPGEGAVEDAVGVGISIGWEHVRRACRVPQPRRLVHLRERLHEHVVLRRSTEGLMAQYSAAPGVVAEA